jgi:hypothetical protein
MKYIQKTVGGKMDGRISGIRYCKGICSVLADHPPIGNQPGAGRLYDTHVFCSKCGTGHGVWMKKESMKANLRCPCCNFLPRMKTKHIRKLKSGFDHSSDRVNLNKHHGLGI